MSDDKGETKEFWFEQQERHNSFESFQQSNAAADFKTVSILRKGKLETKHKLSRKSWKKWYGTKNPE